MAATGLLLHVGLNSVFLTSTEQTPPISCVALQSFSDTGTSLTEQRLHRSSLYTGVVALLAARVNETTAASW